MEPDSNGYVRGSCSAPEQTKPAQTQTLSIRAVSSAHYTTSHERRVYAAGFVDDTEHYCSGSKDLITIMNDLSPGSWATGIGFSWSKFTQYAPDWDEVDHSSGTPILHNGIKVTGWGIWEGGIIRAIVLRTYADTTDKLLDKRRCINDRHTIAALDIMTKIRNIRSRIASTRTPRGETATMWQLIARGILGMPHSLPTRGTLLSFAPSFRASARAGRPKGQASLRRDLSGEYGSSQYLDVW